MQWNPQQQLLQVQCFYDHEVCITDFIFAGATRFEPTALRQQILAVLRASEVALAKKNIIDLLATSFQDSVYQDNQIKTQLDYLRNNEHITATTGRKWLFAKGLDGGPFPSSVSIPKSRILLKLFFLQGRRQFILHHGLTE